MKILALESSGLVASVAVADGDALLGEYTINYKQTHSTTLMPMLDELRSALSLDLSTIDALAVSGGPGSFTGLRIGSASAKGIGLVLDIPIIAVPTTISLACNLWGTRDLICPLMDARRNEVYTGLYRFKEGTLQTEIAQCALPLADMLTAVNERDEHVIFLGDGVDAYRSMISDKCTADYLIAPAHMNRQRAASVAVAAAAGLGVTTSASEHRPEYLRKSQAEREREERQKAESSSEVE